MGSDREFVAYVCEQLQGAGGIASKRMFGEAAVYLDEKVVGMVCDNQFFVKPTEAGRAKLGAPTQAPPFPGASNWFLIADLDDPEFLAELIRVTADALPARKIKAAAKAKAKSKAKLKAKAKVKPKPAVRKKKG